MRLFPHMLLRKYYACLGLSLRLAVFISPMAVFNFYIAMAKDQDFRGRFIKMSTPSLGMAGLSFLIGLLLWTVLIIEV